MLEQMSEYSQLTVKLIHTNVICTNDYQVDTYECYWVDLYKSYGVEMICTDVVELICTSVIKLICTSVRTDVIQFECC